MANQSNCVEMRTQRQSTRMPTVQQTWHKLVERLNALSDGAYRIQHTDFANIVAVQHKCELYNSQWLNVINVTPNRHYDLTERQRKSQLIQHFYKHYGV